MKRLLIILTFLISITLLFSCKKNYVNYKKILNMPYHTRLYYGGRIDKIYEKSDGYFKRSFLDENKIKGVKYKNESYNHLDPNSEEYICDDTLPEKKILIVESKEDYDKILEKDIKVDLDESYLIIYMLYTGGSINEIDDVILKNKNLEIKYLAYGGTPVFCGHIYILAIDKIEFETINFSCSGVIQEFNINWSCTYH